MPTTNQLPSQVSPPEFAFTDAAPSRVVGAAAVAVPVLSGDDGPEFGPGAAELADDTGIDLLELADRLALTGAVGEVSVVPLTARAELANPSLSTLLLVGVGAATTTDVRRAAAALARACEGRDSIASSVHLVGGEDVLTAFVEGAVLASFRFSMRTTQGPVPLRRIVLAGSPDGDSEALARALALAGAGWRSRFLATVPSNIKNPQWLVEQALEGAERAGLKTKVWDERQLAEQGFGGIAAVGRGSDSPPRMVRLDYTPAKGSRKAPHVVIVGKGITFDTGGLNIKPGESMTTMKRDMTGAAIVIAVMEALADLDVPVKVTGLLTIAENAISGDAMRPGDVLTHYDGRTSEVTNTDAEGRLVMADGLAYAAQDIKPDLVVDVATLTGGMKVAMGLRTGGFMTTHDTLADSVVSAGDAAGEPVWRMPLAEVYNDRLKSRIADQVNAPGTSDPITAALFLKPFTAGLPWVHLDLASVGDSPEDNAEWTAGPTGFGPRLLLRWLAADPTKEIS